ncbi:MULTISPECIES: DUF4333 domain-containing protein [unclassified Blastococcus]
MTQLQDPRLAGPSAPQFAAPQQYAPFPGSPLPAPRRRRTGVVVGSVAGAVVALGGLGVGALHLVGSETLDTAAVEERIAELTQELTGVAATGVECPADVEAEAGGTFSCTAVLDGQETSFTVQQTDDQGNVEITGDQRYVTVAEVEAYLLADVVVGESIEVSCDGEGRTVVVGALPEPMVCSVTDLESGDSLDVLVTVADDGTIGYEAA